MDNNSIKKKKKEQLINSEKKYQSFIQRRNELNDLAKVLREERNMIHSKHKEIKESMQKTKTERDNFVLKMKEHRDIRNKLQKQAKSIIEARRKRKGEVFKNLPLRVEELKADVQMLEYRQETVPMNPQEENELIDKIREKKILYEDTIKKLEKQKSIEIEISDKDHAIDELFKKADEEHEKVNHFYNESQKKHEEYIKLVKELSVTISESNKKHEQYIEVKNEAQKNHEKAIEMKSKIISIKEERRNQWKEAKMAIKEQNIKARAAVMDKNKLKEIADQSVDDLKKGKKITL
jgi:phosphoserine phosphatase